MNMQPTRRDLLRAGATAATLAASAPLVSASNLFAPSHPKTLITIYLRGGADWLNMLIPWKDRDYLAARPTLAIGEEQGVVPLDSKFALHPALRPLLPLWENKSFAPILCTGSPHGTRSHFDAQDFMERAAPGMRNIRSGWLNRYLTQTLGENESEFRALAMQPLLPRSMRGDFPAFAVPVGMNQKKSSTTLGQFEEFYGGDPMMMGSRNDEQVVQSGKMTIDTLRRYQEIVKQAGVRDAPEYPGGRFGDRMHTFATLIHAKCGFEVGALDYGGWDHHIQQGAEAGRHNQMLSVVSNGIAAFYKDLGSLSENVTLVVMTEFGRTVRENGNNGTDHGRASGMFVFGGGVRGGKTHGDWCGLESSALVDGRDLPVTTDFRDVMNAILEGTFDFEAEKGFFPEHKPGRLKLF
ncbi:MAG: DUF1501 domain-containing protein [Planctomycetes bacterium]|nr:DUF1501 domain-containing protein [Planctomycetota bacterium]